MTLFDIDPQFRLSDISVMPDIRACVLLGRSGLQNHKQGQSMQ
jgi:hypothetical protein